MQGGGRAGGLEGEGGAAETLQGVLDTAARPHLGRKAGDGLPEVAGEGRMFRKKGSAAVFTPGAHRTPT